MPPPFGKILSKAGESQSSTQGNAARPQQLAHNVQATRSTKRTRSSTGTPPTDQAPASKRRSTRRHARSLVASKQTQPTEVIDLTSDDNQDAELIYREVPRYSTRRNGAQFKDHDTWEGEDHASSRRAIAVRRTEAHNSKTRATAVLMFDHAQTIQILPRIYSGTGTAKPPYTLRTGEYISYPVTISYHLGSMGRYGPAPSQVTFTGFVQAATEDDKVLPASAPRSMLRNHNQAMTQDDQATLSNHSMRSAAADYVFGWGANYGKSIHEVGPRYIDSLLASPRLSQLLEDNAGLREALGPYARDDPRLSSTSSPSLPFTLAMRPSASALKPPAPGVLPNRPPTPTMPHTLKKLGSKPKSASLDVGAQDYVLDFGCHHGKALHQVTPAYLQLLSSNNEILTTSAGLRAALINFFERHPDEYRLDFGKYTGQCLDEVPEDYLVVLESGGGNIRKKELLQCLLWLHNEKVGRSNDTLSKTLNRLE